MVRGLALDPAVTAVFLDAPDELLRARDPGDLWAAAVDCEPPPRRVFRDDAALDDALAGFGDAADLKSPWFTGHWGCVARLARAAAGQLEPAVAGLVHRAGLVHDIGRVAVPTGIWERPGRCGRRSGSWSGPTPITAAGSWPAPRRSRRWVRSPAVITSAPTEPATRPGSAVPSWTRPAACWPRPTSSTRSVSRGRTGPPSAGPKRARVLSGPPCGTGSAARTSRAG